jgi:hypothetical protein
MAIRKEVITLWNIARQEKRKRSQLAVFQPPKRQGEYQGYRAAGPDRAGMSMSVWIGAIIIAMAILLSSLITVAGTRFVGMDSPSEENMWLIDRLTGNVYKCEASERGKAACDLETATGSIGERTRH